MSHRHTPLWPNRLMKPRYGVAEVDHSHPLAEQLITCWPINEGAGLMLSAAGGEHVADISAMTWALGPGLVKPASTTATATSRRTVGSGSAFTLHVLLKVTAASSSAPNTIMAIGDGTDYGSVSLAIQSASSRRLMIFRDCTSADVNAVGPTGLFTLGEPCAITAVCPYSVTAADYSIYKNGVAQTHYSDVNGGTLKTSTLVHPNIGQAGSTTSDYTVYGVWMWSRALSPNEIACLVSDPYCFLRPVTRRRYGWKASGTPAAFAPHLNRGGDYPYCGRTFTGY